MFAIACSAHQVPSVLPLPMCARCHTLMTTDGHGLSTEQLCAYSLRGAFQCIAQPNTTLHDCILYLMQYLYDPGILPSSAN
jgi:hypothetical protein